MERRNTIQKDLVLKAVQKLHGHVTADEVYEAIVKEHPSIGKGTVYRNLGILAEEGKILRVGIPDGPDRFDFTLKKHYHVQCTACGSVSDADMDMEAFPDPESFLRCDGGFRFLSHDILFKGVCPDCRAKTKEG